MGERHSQEKAPEIASSGWCSVHAVNHLNSTVLPTVKKKPNGQVLVHLGNESRRMRLPETTEEMKSLPCPLGTRPAAPPGASPSELPSAAQQDSVPVPTPATVYPQVSPHDMLWGYIMIRLSNII